MSTPGPWKIEDCSDEKKGGYIRISGPNGESICQLFPLAGYGGVGVQQALENAAKIVQAWKINQ